MNQEQTILGGFAAKGYCQRPFWGLRLPEILQIPGSFPGLRSHQRHWRNNPLRSFCELDAPR